ncbi:hypothetical protein HanPI659440_Chr17g0684861 [Helianthus annuus]|nr:hypothetical protein HanPI659440_Chr17g0684861 [Helianthus annuus]
MFMIFGSKKNVNCILSQQVIFICECVLAVVISFAILALGGSKIMMYDLDRKVDKKTLYNSYCYFFFIFGTN